MRGFSFQIRDHIIQTPAMPTTTRPVVFIGSSSEGLPVTQALQLNLDRCAEVILWNQGVFGLSEGTLENLVDRLIDFDFAILVLTPDDLVSSRGTEGLSPRDNVVFELGLFMGALGRTRTFIVYDRTANIRLPSDLAGVTAATYQPPTAGSLQSALGACCTMIQSAIEAQGLRPRAGAEAPIDPGVQFRVLADLLEESAHQFFILMHEAGATLQREGRYMLGPRYEYDARDRAGHSMGHGSFDVGKMCDRLADAGLLTVDLRNRVGLSDRGHAFAEWLIASGFKATYFWSDVGTWGERPAEMRPFEHPNSGPRNVFELQARVQRPATQGATTGKSTSPPPAQKSNQSNKRKPKRH